METQNNELEVMRHQLAILNKKLESQEIVNDRLMREAMKNKMSWIRKLVWLEMIVVPFLILFFLGLTVACDLSFGPTIFMSVMLIANTIADYKINMIADSNFLEGNLAETALRLTKMKRRRMINEMIGIPLAFIWVVWFLYDIYTNMPSDGVWHSALYGGFIGGIIGGVLGFALGITTFRKMQKTNDEVIRQINELRETSPESE